MIKVFLVEDEIVIRRAVKNSINWEKEGYEFVGEAADGELAYPLILKERPDILITDIKMPFMDGLELSEAVKKEMPDIKILILSGYNDFKYAKEAIGIGVTDYLLKPISAEMLLKALGEISEVIQKERGDREIIAQYTKDMQENLEHKKLALLRMLISGTSTTKELIDGGKELGLNIGASLYNFLLFKCTENDNIDSFITLEKMFGDMKNILYFERGIEGWALLCMANSEEEMEALGLNLKEQIEEIMDSYNEIKYFGGFGENVYRLGDLGSSFAKAEKTFARRFTMKENQIIFWDNISDVKRDLELEEIPSIDEYRKLVERFIKKGTHEEVGSFIEAYFDVMSKEHIESEMMRQYLILDIYVSAVYVAEQMEIDSAEIVEEIGDSKIIIHDLKNRKGITQVKEYLRRILTGIIHIRDTKSGRGHKDIIDNAIAYIRGNYMSTEINLNTISKSVGMSPSYFSAVFSQSMGQTFIEYLTETRMEKAKELLMCTSMKTTEIGFEVGYKDSHYFSYIFKKTQECSPKEYRQRRRSV